MTVNAGKKELTVLDGSMQAPEGNGEEAPAGTSGDNHARSGYDLEDRLGAFVEKGLELAKEGRYDEALNIFEEDLCFTTHPEAMSFYALCLASVEARYDQAISLCLMAVEREFYNPNIYLNLGRIFLLNGQKAVAYKAFRKGLSFDNAHAGLVGELKRLGLRRKPVLPFLSRKNTVNKFLGLLSRRLGL